MTMTSAATPHHGGRLVAAARRYGIAPADWLDLSTGINPRACSLPAVPAEVWRRLPEDDDALTDIAACYYGCRTLLPVAGSQAAIQALPRLRAPGRVAVLAPMYAEHAHAWRRAGHAVTELPAAALTEAAGFDVLVLANPNNPTGHCFEPRTLLAMHDRLPPGGWLVVDEAFVDATPAASLAGHGARPGLIVLRSLGKFFGLAGARVGFVLAANDLLQALADALGPWPLAGPSRLIAAAALADRAWQDAARARLIRDGARLGALLERNGLRPAGGCALFQWVATGQAAALHGALARRGILTRLFEDPPSLRFGLPGNEDAWRRLDAALTDVARQTAAAP
jgi:cobalamin biosynthetic protein CobC